VIDRKSDLKMGPGDPNRDHKFHRDHGLIAVGLFELPATLPGHYLHWCDIRWYRVLDIMARHREAGIQS
jgi:hypothetical protein